MTVFVIALVVTVFRRDQRRSWKGSSRRFRSPSLDRNVIVMRVGAQSETQTPVTPDQIETLKTLPGVERNGHGDPLASPELVVLINTAKRDGTEDERPDPGRRTAGGFASCGRP